MTLEIVEQGPIPAIHGVARWRLIDLVQWLHDEFAVSLDETTVKLIDQPWRIMTIGRGNWARGS